jgi:hypothetical protein
MRYLTFSVGSDSVQRLGMLQDGGVAELPGTLLDLIREGPAAWARPR